MADNKELYQKLADDLGIKLEDFEKLPKKTIEGMVQQHQRVQEKEAELEAREQELNEREDSQSSA